MFAQTRLVVSLCLLSLFVALPGWTDEPEKVPTLQDAKTIEDISSFIHHESAKNAKIADEKQRNIANADVYYSAGDKLLEITSDVGEKRQAYSLKGAAFSLQIQAGIEGAEQKWETLLNELDATEEFKEFVTDQRFTKFLAISLNTVNTPESFGPFKEELKTWINKKIFIYYLAIQGFMAADRCGASLDEFADELVKFVQSAECTLSTQDKKNAVETIKDRLVGTQFDMFATRAFKAEKTPENFDAFKTEFKTWVARKFDYAYLANIGLVIAEQNNVPTEQFAEEILEYARSSDSPLSAAEKRMFAATWEKALRTAVGSDPKLYGKTLDGKDFDWESLRGKYVLIKFTATWCGPCKGEIPGMLEAYKKYHDKGFEIVSVYVWEHGADPVDGVKKEVEKEKLPWIIIAEALSEEKSGADSKSMLGNALGALATMAGKAPLKHSEYYVINGVPTMLLVGKDGKIISTTEVRGEALQTKLAEIFE